MALHNAYYSIIQFCPDRGRAEGANIGVVVLCPSLGFIDVKTSAGNDRVRRFFGARSFDPQRLNVMKRAIEARVREKSDWRNGLEDLERFIASRANDLQLTPPRAVKTADPAAELASLFDELVGGRSQASSNPRHMFPQLDRALREPGVREKVRFDESVTIPLLGRSLRVPYAFQNGTLNLIKPQRFSAEPDHATAVAGQLAIKGSLLARHAGTVPTQLIVVPAFPDELASRVDDILELFREYEVRVVQEKAIPDLVAEIIAQAH